MRLPTWLSNHLAALRALLVLTVLLGVLYPLALLVVAQIPGLKDNADGSLLRSGDTVVGSSLIGQSFTDADGAPLVQYFQSRPSAGGYDPLASGATNLGPESVVDTLPDAAAQDTGTPSLLTEVCTRSRDIGRLEGVDGSRPYCTADGVGAVLSVVRADGLTGRVVRVVSVNQACPARPFVERYEGVAVECATPGDIPAGVITPVRGDAPADPVVPADAVTASGSGLDPHISPAYAALQAPRVARERGVDPAAVTALIEANTSGRTLGFLGEPTVNVLELNVALDQRYPFPARA
jgi:K+-transporting ATPase ATPase C chain